MLSATIFFRYTLCDIMSDAPSINLLSPISRDTHTGRTRRRLRLVAILAILGIAGAVTAYTGLRAPTESLGEVSGPLSFLAQVGRLIISADKPLDGTKDDRINMLLLGIGGAGHDGPQLTDTIMLLSVKPSQNRAALISIPRDLLAELPGYGWRKINNANAFAEMNTPGSGGAATAAVVENMLGLDIPYYVRIDFRGFEKLIDELGGITVTVDRSFTDAQYPAANDEVQTVSFSAGETRMDGARALIFARSRHGSNGEGSDFARSRRQQKILIAARDKLLSAGTLTNPKRISTIVDILRTHISTNVEAWEMLRLADIGSRIDAGALGHLVFSDAPDNVLVPAVVETAFVLVPRGNDYGLLARAAQSIFDDSSAISADTPTKNGGGIRIEIQNGTRLEGLAGETSSRLSAQGYIVTSVGNAEKQNYERTVIYDLSNGQHPQALGALRTSLSADVSVSLPGWIVSDDIPSRISLSPPKTQANNIDFLIILGNSSVSPNAS